MEEEGSNVGVFCCRGLTEGGISAYCVVMAPQIPPDPPTQRIETVQTCNKTQIGFLIPAALRQHVEGLRFSGESLTDFCVEAVRREVAHRSRDAALEVERLSADLVRAVAQLRNGKGVEL